MKTKAKCDVPDCQAYAYRYNAKCERHEAMLQKAIGARMTKTPGRECETIASADHNPSLWRQHVVFQAELVRQEREAKIAEQFADARDVDDEPGDLDDLGEPLDVEAEPDGIEPEADEVERTAYRIPVRDFDTPGSIDVPYLYMGDSYAKNPGHRPAKRDAPSDQVKP
jgi:hypothetical protein